MCDALGIIAYNDPNTYVKGIQNYRPIAGFNFLGRYRLVDFPISNMTNSGIDQICVFVKGNPRSLIDHIGDGRQYNINSKHGSLNLIPHYADNNCRNVMFTPDIESYYNNLYELNRNKNEYVVIAPVNMIYACNYADVLEQHIKSGADVSMLYQSVDDAKEKYVNCDVLQLNRQSGILSIDMNLGKTKSQNLSLQTYILSKNLFIELVKEAHKLSSMYWFKDIVNEHCKDMDIRGIHYKGKMYCINDLQSYFDTNLDLLNEESLKAFMKPNWPVYTRTNDSAPAIYLKKGKACKSFISNGCRVNGEVSNSIVGRSCIIGKNAVVDHCVIMPEVEIGDDAILRNVVVDKNSKIIRKKELIGQPDEPLYIDRRENV